MDLLPTSTDVPVINCEATDFKSSASSIGKYPGRNSSTASTMMRVTRVPSHPVWPKASCTLPGTDTLDAHLDYFRIFDKPAVITGGSSTSWNDQSFSEKLIIVASPLSLFQDVIQPVEYDLVLKA
ncbi:MAG: hypothetical protein WCC25_01460, partial [Candidatus Korobacteraceae bacterium]